MKTNFDRGVTRIWVVFVGIAEFAVLVRSIAVVRKWYSENHFDQFDVGYISVWQRLLPFLVLVIVISATAYIAWRIVRWIVQGFSD